MAPALLPALGLTTALALYLNAKHHIVHDLRQGRHPLVPSPSYLAAQAEKKQLLTYHVLVAQAEAHPTHPAVIFEGRTWSYAQLVEGVTRVANWLIAELGVAEGEVVAVDGGNCVEYLMIWFAIEAVGGVAAFVNWNLTGEGLRHCVKVCGARYLITDEDVRANVEPVRDGLAEMGVEIKYYSPALIAGLPDTTPVPASRTENITPESVRGLIYTSGTTGLPKAVALMTARELLVGHLVARYLELKPSDRFYTCMPLYHGAAHGLCVSPSIHAGCTIVLGRKFSHRTFWPEVATSRANIIQYVGELCRYLLNGKPNPYERAHCVKMAWGNGMRPDVWEPFRQRFGIPIIHELYAATDGLGPSFIANRGEFTANTIGLRGTLWNWRFGNEEVRVRMNVDTEDIMRDERGFAIRCGVNEPGQVLHRLDPKMVVAPSYFGNDEATTKRRISDVFEKGDLWFASGDMMRQDSEGRLYFVDRLGDTFRWKSENVSTNEVADQMGKFPQIAETSVYGVTVPGNDGRAGMASIVMATGVTENDFDFAAMAQYARRVLPGYAVPLFLRITPALEYTGTLKVQKSRLKREGIDLDLVTGDDRIYWLPVGSERYVPFERKDWEAIKEKRVRLT